MDYYNEDGEWRDYKAKHAKHPLHTDIHCYENNFPPDFRNNINQLHSRLDELRGCGFKSDKYCYDGHHSLHDLSHILHKIEKSVYYNGAFYDDVKTENFYDSDSSCAYTLTTIPRKREIPIKTYFARNDKSNSKVTEDGFSASSHLLADKLITAYNGHDANGFTGIVFSDGALIDTLHIDDTFTCGFNRNGHLKAYDNNITTASKLVSDGICDSMGCEGILINNGNISSVYFGENGGIKTSRTCIAESTNGKFIYFISVSDYDTVNQIDGSNTGMTAQQIANVLMNLGVITAVCTCSGNTPLGAAAFDKGEVVLKPASSIIQSNYVYWYISKKRCFPNEFTYDIANLTIKYGELKYYWGLELDGIEVLINRLLALEQKIVELETTINDHETRITNIETWKQLVDQQVEDILIDISNIQSELESLGSRITNLESTINTLDQTLNGVLETITDIMSVIEELKQQWLNIINEFNSLKSYVENVVRGAQVKIFANPVDAKVWLETNYNEAAEPSSALVFYTLDPDNDSRVVAQNWARSTIAGGYEWNADGSKYLFPSGGGNSEPSTFGGVFDTGWLYNDNQIGDVYLWFDTANELITTVDNVPISLSYEAAITLTDGNVIDARASGGVYNGSPSVSNLGIIEAGTIATRTINVNGNDETILNSTYPERFIWKTNTDATSFPTLILDSTIADPIITNGELRFPGDTYFEGAVLANKREIETSSHIVYCESLIYIYRLAHDGSEISSATKMRAKGSYIVIVKEK